MLKKILLGTLSLVLLCLVPVSTLASDTAPPDPSPLGDWEDYLPSPLDSDDIAIIRERREDPSLPSCLSQGKTHRLVTSNRSGHTFFDGLGFDRCGAWDVNLEYCWVCGFVLRHEAAFTAHTSLHDYDARTKDLLPFPPTSEKDFEIPPCIDGYDEHNYVTADQSIHTFYPDRDQCGTWEFVRVYCTRCDDLYKNSVYSNFAEHDTYHEDYEDHTFYGNYDE